MKYKNVKPTTYMGMDYRSMLETRYGIHFKSLGFDVDYEPEVPGLFGYRPDFVIYPKRKKCDYLGEVKPIYVEIKPIRDVTKIFEDPDYDSFREKVYKNWNRENDLIIFGGNVFNRYDKVAAVALCWQNNFPKHYGSYAIHYSIARESNKQIGLSWHHAELYTENDHTYPVENIGDNEKEAAEYIEGSFNRAWSKLQWKPE